jgi:predicted GIY-YIG superfamily endonuclease
MSRLILLGGSSSSSKRRGGLRKPKLKKFPKMPKSFKLEVLSSYAKKCEGIKKENALKLSEYNKKVKLRTDAKAKITAMKKQIAKMKGRD